MVGPPQGPVEQSNYMQRSPNSPRDLACTLAPDDDFDRLNKNSQIKQQSVVLHVEEVILELLDRILLRGTVRIAELRPPCNARFDRVALPIVRDALVQLLHELGALRARTDEAHLAAQHVQYLRQLIDSRQTKK